VLLAIVGFAPGLIDGDELRRSRAGIMATEP
jgi:hypothetical protein